MFTLPHNLEWDNTINISLNDFNLTLVDWYHDWIVSLYICRCWTNLVKSRSCSTLQNSNASSLPLERTSSVRSTRCRNTCWPGREISITPTRKVTFLRTWRSVTTNCLLIPIAWLVTWPRYCAELADLFAMLYHSQCFISNSKLNMPTTLCLKKTSEIIMAIVIQAMLNIKITG